MILTAVEARGVPFRKSRSKYEAAYFEKGRDRLHLAIEEPVVTVPRKPTAREKRRPSWQWQTHVSEPSGRLTFSISVERYASRAAKRWTEGDKASLEEVLSRVVEGICQHYIELERKRVEEAERWRKQQEAYEIQQQAERKRQHEAAMENTAHTLWCPEPYTGTEAVSILAEIPAAMSVDLMVRMNTQRKN